jgi:hypothetical protein
MSKNILDEYILRKYHSVGKSEWQDAGDGAVQRPG